MSVNGRANDQPDDRAKDVRRQQPYVVITYLPLHRRVVKQAKHTGLKILHEDTLRVQISPRRPNTKNSWRW